MPGAVVSRRGLIAGAGATVGLATLPSCAGAASGYDAAARRLRAPMGVDHDSNELIRYATLAANSHNSQPWRFAVEATRILIRPDPRYRLPAVDPRNHHLYCSLGCAAENLAVAAAAQGRAATIRFDSRADAVVVTLTPTPPVRGALLGAVARRQCTRLDYDARPLPTTELAAIARAAQLGGVECRLITRRPEMDAVKALILEGNSAQMRDQPFVAELKRWIRFDDTEAIRTGDGLSSFTTGSPSVPRWLGRRMFDFMFTDAGETTKITRWIDTSSGLAVFTAATDDPAGWVAAGRSYQRFALATTAMDIRHAHLNMPIEVPALRERFARQLGLGTRRPDLLVRFGHGPLAPYSLRRPVAAVIA